MAKTERSVCENCEKEFLYDPNQSGGRFCCWDCRMKAHSKIIKESYTPELRKRRSESTKKQMLDPKQIQIRREKCGKNSRVSPRKGVEVSEETRIKISESRTKNVDYRKLALDHYGNKCQRCGEEFDLDQLVVHHVDGDHYIDEITDNSIENLMVLCKSCHMKLHSEMRKLSNRFKGQYNFEQAANYILTGLRQMGFEIDYENFKDTPKRFARAYYEIFEGVKDTNKEVTSILATSFPSEGFRDMIVEKDIICFSMCPHHLLPVEYHVCVGYIPSESGEVLGISKLSRLVNLLAKRPVLQERFTHEIVDELSRIHVDGAIAVVEGQHMCMRMRGAKAIGSTVTTTSVSGLFESDPSAKHEFFEHIKNRKRFS